MLVVHHARSPMSPQSTRFTRTYIPPLIRSEVIYPAYTLHHGPARTYLSALTYASNHAMPTTFTMADVANYFRSLRRLKSDEFLHTLRRSGPSTGSTFTACAVVATSRGSAWMSTGKNIRMGVANTFVFMQKQRPYCIHG